MVSTIAARSRTHWTSSAIASRATAINASSSNFFIIVWCPFRKYHPEVALLYSSFKFPVLACKFPVPSQKFPVLLSREFHCKPLNLLAYRLSKLHLAGGFAKIPWEFGSGDGFDYDCVRHHLCPCKKQAFNSATSGRLRTTASPEAHRKQSKQTRRSRVTHSVPSGGLGQHNSLRMLSR